MTPEAVLFLRLKPPSNISSTGPTARFQTRILHNCSHSDNAEDVLSEEDRVFWLGGSQ